MLKQAFARLLFCLLIVAAPAAAHAGPASDFIKRLGAEAVETLTQTEGDLAAREARFRAILAESFDMQGIAQFAMGRYWSQASAEQKYDYVQAFTDYVLATYSRRLGGYSGETFSVTGEREVAEGEALVASEIVRGGAPPILAEWRVRLGGDGPKVIDVAIEGVSMSVTQRAEFASVIRQQGINGLIAVLEARGGRLGTQS